LKRLHHLLTGKTGTKNILRFRLHTWVLLGVMLAFHLGCFIAIILLISSEGNIVDELTAQGAAAQLHCDSTTRTGVALSTRSMDM
jgi:hypothetical protein